MIVKNCAVRTLIRSTGRVTGVVTERGEIRCDQVLLAGALWSRKFLANLDVSLPTLPRGCSVIHTALWRANGDCGGRPGLLLPQTL